MQMVPVTSTNLTCFPLFEFEPRRW